MKSKHKLDNFTNDEIIDILNNSKSFLEAIKKFGYQSISTGHYKQVKNELDNRNIEKPIYRYYGDFQKINRKTSQELFVENSKSSTGNIKKRIIGDNLLEYKCEKCGNTGQWKNEKLILQLEHKNGISNDNRVDNLEWMCPNCHSQTDTFSGRNKKYSPLV